jgi:hypothetical protein
MQKVLNQDFSCYLDIEEVLNYAAVYIKLLYNHAYKLIEFNIGNYIYIYLYKGYYLLVAKYLKIM